MSQVAIKIMMIDNDPAAHCYHEAMIENAGLNMDYVRTYLDANLAIEALEQIIEESPKCLPDVILIDIHMPNLDGWSFVEKVKKMNFYANFPQIYMVSNSLDASDELKAEKSEVVRGFKQKFLDGAFFKELYLDFYPD